MVEIVIDLLSGGSLSGAHVTKIKSINIHLPSGLSVAMLYIVFRTHIHLKVLSLPVILSGRRAL